MICKEFYLNGIKYISMQHFIVSGSLECEISYILAKCPDAISFNVFDNYIEFYIPESCLSNFENEYGTIRNS